MNSKQALQKIRVMLGMETEAEAVNVELAEVELLDGTIVKVEGDLAEGKALFVITEEGDIPAPEGTHETKDGLLISVGADGVITSVEEKPEPAIPLISDVVSAEEMSEEEVSNETDYSNELIGAIAELIKPLNEKIEAIEGKFSTLDTDFNKFRNEPAAPKVSNNTFSTQENNKNARLEAIASLRKK